MAATITSLESPVDVMLLIHKALRAEGARAEKLVQDLEAGSSLQPFKLAFNSWAAALVYHAEAELGIDITAVYGQQNGRAPSSYLQPLISALVAQEDQEHLELIEGLQNVLTILDEDIGKTSVITRTKHHLYGQVLALRITQDDHLETEEALVLPILRQNLSEEKQLAVTRGLLIDDSAQHPRWIVQWVLQELDPSEQVLLAELESRLAAPL